MAEEMPLDEGPEPKGLSRKQVALLVAAVLVIAAVIAASLLPSLFLGYKLGILDFPGLGSEPMKMLVIGEPSAPLLADLDSQRDLVYYRVKDASSLEQNPAETLAQYDAVLLDQHLGATPFDKSVSRVLGEALQNYVQGGGKLIVVMDSGIYRSGGGYGNSIATDVVGWQANFGDLIPVECDTGPNEIRTCTVPVAVSGKIYRQDFEHAIMKGIEVAPADPNYGPLQIVTFDVKVAGSQVAYIKHAASAVNYAGIAEKKLLVGKSIYFNYDPALTPGIWQNTLEYLR
jgi:hypothetical protein